ncbi:ATPase [Pseudonocardiaceae bacterium YIM PH 21723]|nr:ATPase [Pseudonocardiaceae bacterium YIM PH 21723]
MPIDILTEILIRVPRDQVADFAADPSNAPEWSAFISSVKWQTRPPLSVGSRLGFVASLLGRHLEYTYEIVDYQPGERLVMATRNLETTYAWFPENGATRMTLRNRGELPGLARVTAPMLSVALRRTNRKDLVALKALLERTIA